MSVVVYKKNVSIPDNEASVVQKHTVDTLSSPVASLEKQIIKEDKKDKANQDLKKFLTIITKPMLNSQSKKLTNKVFNIKNLSKLSSKDVTTLTVSFEELFSDKVKEEINNLKEERKTVLILKNMPVVGKVHQFRNTPYSIQKTIYDKDKNSENLSLILGVGGLKTKLLERYKKTFSRIIFDPSHDTPHTSYMKTQSSYRLNNPEYTIISCLKSSENIKLQLLPSKILERYLSPALIDALKQSEFIFKSVDGSKQIVAPVLSGNPEQGYDIRLNLNPGMMETIPHPEKGNRAQKALDQLRHIITKQITIPTLVLQSGEVLVLNGRKVLIGIEATRHNKTSFIAQKGHYINEAVNFRQTPRIFKDAKGRWCDEIIPLRSIYQSVTDFCKNASEEEKLDLLEIVKNKAKPMLGYRLIMRTDPISKKLRIFLAYNNALDQQDTRWEKGRVYHKGRPVSVTWNPLYEKALPNLSTTKDFSKIFVVFPNQKPNRDLIVPMQGKDYTDIVDFIERSTKAEKMDFFDIVGKHTKSNFLFYTNGKKSRHVPTWHNQIVSEKEFDSKNKE